MHEESMLGARVALQPGIQRGATLNVRWVLYIELRAAWSSTLGLYAKRAIFRLCHGRLIFERTVSHELRHTPVTSAIPPTCPAVLRPMRLVRRVSFERVAGTCFGQSCLPQPGGLESHSARALQCAALQP